MAAVTMSTVQLAPCVCSMMPAPSLVEEDIGGLGADRLLVGLGDRRVVEVIPVTVHLVLPVGRVCEKRS